MKAFIEVELPDFCYLAEAVDWIAFGELPQASFVEERSKSNPAVREYVDFRQSEEAIGEAHYGGTSVARRHFESNEIPVDYDRYDMGFYLDAAAEERTWKMWNSQIDKSIAEEVEVPKNFYAWRDEAAENLAEAKYAEEAHAWTEGITDLAKGRLFERLRDGQLIAEGVLRDAAFAPVAPDEDDHTDEDEAPCLIPILPREWTLRRCSWDDSSLEAARGEFTGILVKVGRLIELFPHPMEGGSHMEGHIFGRTFIPNNGLEVQDARVERGATRARGRPQKGGGAIATAVQREFERRLRAGELPDKADAIYKAASEWAELIFGEELGRSTAQRYLKNVLATRG